MDLEKGKDMDKEFLKTVATAILSAIEGSGYWRVWGQADLNARNWRVKKPLLGLSRGDTVYGYDSDEESITEQVVVYVHEGIGYVIRYSDSYGPTLSGVGKECESTTLEGAICKHRSSIENGLKYLDEKAEGARALRKVIGETI